MSFPLVSTARASRNGPDPAVAARCLSPLAARVKPRARRYEADVAAVGVPVPDTGTDDEGGIASTTSSSSSSSSSEAEEDGDGNDSSTSTDDDRRRAPAARRGRANGMAAAAAAAATPPPTPRTVTLAGLLTPTGGRKVLAVLRGGRLLLTPVDASLALLPCLGGREGSGLGGPSAGGPSTSTPAKAEPGTDGSTLVPQPLTPVTVRVNRRETERQVEAREASYAHLAELEGREAWVPVRAISPPLPAGAGGRPARKAPPGAAAAR